MKKKVLWAGITTVLSVLTIYTLFYNSGLSLTELSQDIKEATPIWLIPAVLCMLAFIFFEGHSLVLILRTLGYPVKKRRGFLYASADIYFSSITPSATGGQPASAYFMHKDGIPTEVVTVSLILNLTMYTLAIITLGIISLICCPNIFIKFALPCRIMILIGILAMILLTVFFILLLKKQAILLSMGNLLVRIMQKLHFKNSAGRFKIKLDNMIEKYNECVSTLAGKKKLLFKTFFLNLFQRSVQILVPVFCYYAIHGNLADGFKVFIIQTYVVMGSNFIPVPGAIGISEFLMFYGYTMLLNEEAAYSLAILSRGIAFYSCIFISIFTVIFGYIIIRKQQKKDSLLYKKAEDL